MTITTRSKQQEKKNKVLGGLGDVDIRKPCAESKTLVARVSKLEQAVFPTDTCKLPVNYLDIETFKRENAMLREKMLLEKMKETTYMLQVVNCKNKQLGNEIIRLHRTLNDLTGLIVVTSFAHIAGFLYLTLN
jgi:hypothetical protein